jgi:nucleotide-binding universal stress UspA family protein
MKTILVALDNSTVAPNVVEAAVAMARSFGASLIFARAVGLPTELPPEALTMDADGLAGLLEKNALRELTLLTASVPEGVARTHIVQVGTPWQVVCELAETHDVDLIMLGAHGRRLVDRVLGTTTNRVVSHTRRSVYVVRPQVR